MLSQLRNKIAYVLEGGPCSKGIESTIVGIANDRCVLYRAGATSVASLEACIQEPLIQNKVQIKNTLKKKRIEAPGMLTKHYAPLTPLYVLPAAYTQTKLPPLKAQEPYALLCFKNYCKDHPRTLQRILSSQGSLEEAAYRLFSTLHELDELQLKYILAEKVPEHGIGQAINDRLRRAAEKAFPFS